MGKPAVQGMGQLEPAIRKQIIRTGWGNVQNQFLNDEAAGITATIVRDRAAALVGMSANRILG
ncbi:MAG: hypothetical protein DMD39_01600 [Gemmatimonadetes bacterium]|nr:MAG: hypothetical protein DMD39_01600 [Gemmatimonadota bacterium]